LAYEWLLRADPSARERLLPDFLDDPSNELRRAAVALAIEQANGLDPSTDKARVLAAYRRALSSARDQDQVRSLAKRLEDLGEAVDLPAHFGFLLDWRLMGPFDNTDRRGYHLAFSPEKELVADAVYKGPFGDLKWLPYTSADRYGTVDLNAALGTRKQVTAYAWTEFVSAKAQEVEFRWSTYNASKLWLNGQLVADNEIYHSGERFDQYRARGKLLEGKNTLLLKVCQNEQTESWARFWKFKLRVCDAKGTAVLSTDRTASAKQ
jgi:hypothetical protein